MPYIRQDRRDELDQWGTYPDSALPMTPGEINYEVTSVVVEYIKRYGVTYQTINDIIGALEGAKLEFYRCVAVPFESQKMVTNGDVYPRAV